MIDRGRARGRLPLYGSADWAALRENDPRRVAAAVAAAEAWREYTSTERVAADLRRQLDDEDMAVLARLRQASWDVSASRDWVVEAARPTYDELRRRRGQAA